MGALFISNWTRAGKGLVKPVLLSPNVKPVKNDLCQPPGDNQTTIQKIFLFSDQVKGYSLLSRIEKRNSLHHFGADLNIHMLMILKFFAWQQQHPVILSIKSQRTLVQNIPPTPTDPANFQMTVNSVVYQLDLTNCSSDLFLFCRN